MSTRALPITREPTLAQSLWWVLRPLIDRLMALDLRYVDPWERKRW